MFKDSLWALVGNALNKGLSLLGGIVVARMLGVVEYGEYGMIKTTLYYIAVFSTFGLGFSVTKYIAQSKEEADGRMHLISSAANIISICFSGFLALLLFIFANQVAVFLDDSSVASSLRYTSVAILFNSLATVQIAVLAGMKEFKRTARINFYIGIITFVASVGLTWLIGLDGAIAALAVANFANCILNYLLIRRIIPPTTITRAELQSQVKDLIRFSFPIAIQESTISIAYWLGSLMLVKLTDYAQVGLYSVAVQWGSIVLYIPGVLQNVMLSHLCSEASHHDSQKKMLRNLLWLNFVITLVPLLIVTPFSGLIARMYGPSYSALPPVLLIVLAGSIISCLAQVYTQAYIAESRTWSLTTIRMIRDIGGLIFAFAMLCWIKSNGAIVYAVSIILFRLIAVILLAIFHRTPKVIIPDDSTTSIY